jgi:hypothetical protein
MEVSLKICQPTESGIVFDGDQAIIRLPKMVLVMSREQFVAALKKGKIYRRREAMAARMPQPEPAAKPKA